MNQYKANTVEPIQSILLWIENQQRLEEFHILCFFIV